MLSVIIPARNEKYLENTIKDVLKNAHGDIEVLVMLDGYIPDPQIVTNDNRVMFYHMKDPIGQRACINKGAQLAKGQYIMKLDAHCAVSEGFDLMLAEDCDYNWTMVPRMYNLDVDTWKPKFIDDTAKAIKYGKLHDYMYIGFNDKNEFRTLYYPASQNKEMHKRPALIDDTMSCMGCCFFMHKDRFWELEGCDEKHGGWGQQGVEVSCKAWLSGGALKVNKRTWFAHWFRGGSGPGFPYHMSGAAVDRARDYSRDLWLNNKWGKQIRDFSWLQERFDMSDKRDDLTILFYTANVVSRSILDPVVRSLKRHGYPIVSVSHKPMDLGTNIVVPKGRSLQKIYEQVLVGAKAAKTKYVALCEDDCLYVAEHFKRRPVKAPFAYNLNRWLLHMEDSIYTYRKRPILSQCIADREALIKNLEERVKMTVPDEYCGEPGCFEDKIGMTKYEYETFETKEPNLVICHNKNIMGRKYWGKDAEPVKTLPVWGEASYWVAKMTPRAKWGRSAHPNRQHCHIGSVILDVEEMYQNRMDYGDPRKLDQLKIFMDVFPAYLGRALAREMTDDELMQEGYFEYLMKKYKTDAKSEYKKQHTLFLLRDAVSLYNDIKENGLKNPLDMWREGDRLVLHRGGRRLEIIHRLGYKRVPCRVFRTKELFIKLNPGIKTASGNTIHSIGEAQFRKLKERATDKYWVHGYTHLYEKYLGYLRPTARKVLELGVFRGASLLLWREAFPKAQIYGVDHKLRTDMVIKPDEKRITYLLGSQQDKAFMAKQVVSQGPFDIIVDDAGHRGNEMTESFKVLWDSIVPGGWYVLEDLYGHYRKDRLKISMMPMLKNMIDDMMINCRISSMSFHYNICFIQKNS